MTLNASFSRLANVMPLFMLSSISARNASTGVGSARNDASCSSVYGVSTLGITQLAVRWNRCTCPAVLMISGTNCTALAALPMTATRSPARS